jgi:hypothetical protein
MSEPGPYRLDALVDAILELRASGATVIKIDKDLAVTVAFDAPMELPGTPRQPVPSAAEQERAMLFASADDD